MRTLLLLGLGISAANGASETPAGKLWNELKAQREQLSGIHQEFEVSRTFKSAKSSQSAKYQIVVDMSAGHWREKSVSGSGTRVRIFDGADLYSMEEGGDEFLRIKRRSKEPDPVPAPYLPNEADWSKGQEVERRACKAGGKDDQCVLLEVRLKPWSRSNGGAGTVTTMLEGTARVLLDTESGLILSLRIVELIQNPRSAYQSDYSYQLARYSYGAPAEKALFELPAGVREVKELSRWKAAKIKKEFAGKAAPELAVTDIQGNAVALSSFRGKTVLLDFWTTWCPPCRADAPALDKLYRKYGDQDLMIIGISVSEERAIVEKFLKEHPHSFPTALSTENELPTAYQIGVFPTYIVIERDGTLASAVEGDQGFSELRKLLKKAGLEVE